MSNVVTSQPRQQTKINSKELPSSEINCERCREDDDQCCFVYFYSLYCSQCRCSGCCDEKKQKRRIPQRREVNYFSSDQRPQRHGVNNYYRSDNDIMFNDDTLITRGFLDNENGLIHTYSDHRQSHVPEYGVTPDNLTNPSEGEDQLGDNIGNRGPFGSGHHSVLHSEDVGHRGASVCHSEGEGHSGESFKLEGRSSDNNGEGGRSGGKCPSGNSGGYSWEHSESGGYLGVSSRGGGHCVSGGNSAGENNSDMHCWDRDDSGCKSEGNNAGGDTSGDCGRDDTVGDTGGDGGGGDTGGDCGGGDTGGDCGGGDSGGGDTGGDCGGGDTGGDCGGGGDD